MPADLQPVGLGRRWLALWIIQLDSQRTLRSSSERKGRRGSVMTQRFRWMAAR